MNVKEMNNLVKENISPNVYIIVQSEDAKLADDFEISDVIQDTLLFYKGSWDFEEEIIEQIKDDFYGSKNIDAEIQRVLKKCKRISGIFIILLPKCY